MGRALWNALRASAGAYGFSLSAFLILRYAEGEAFNYVALINNFLHLMVLPTLVLLPLMLLDRRWWAVAVLAAPFGMAVIDTADALTVPPPPETPTDVTEITVLTYNLLARGGPPSAFAETIDIIQEADADIVALQEVSFAAEAALTPALTDAYPFAALYPRQFGTQGQGLFSRYPITESAFFQSPNPVQLGHMRALLDVDGRAVAVYNLHPIHPFMSPGLDVGVRSADIAYVLERAEAESATTPTLFVGDFNMTPKTADYATVTAVFSDAFVGAGRGFGFTYPEISGDTSFRFIPPIARLDYIFHSPHWTAQNAHVLPRSGGADHRPLLATLALLPE
jgi:endonuclease/exonuclease/phosphatase (EEP) superfamily protein YafD